MDSAARFPLALVSGAVAAAAGCVLAGKVEPFGSDEEPWTRLMASASLGIPFCMAGVLVLERLRSSGARFVQGGLVFRACHVLPASVPALFYLCWPEWTSESVGIRLAHLIVLAHLALIVGPWLGRPETAAFWHFNWRVFVRFVLGGIYAAALFGGLAAALAGLDNLFGVPVPDETYLRLFFVLAFLFHPWFVVAGVPRVSDPPGGDYPAWLRAFAQYVLVPLVCLYFLILTAYMLRVAIQSDWPSGWIGYLASTLAVVGVLSIVMVHPERERPGREWIARYSRWFWLAILPQTGMLAVAIWQRVDQYGVTEPRYLLAAGTVWLAGAALYAMLRKPVGILWIPSGIAVVALVAFAGPWSAYDVSRQSQSARLVEILSRHGGIEDGRMRAIEAPIPRDDATQIDAVVNYLASYHGAGALDPWFEGGVAELPPVFLELGGNPSRLVRRVVAFLAFRVEDDPAPETTTEYEVRAELGLDATVLVERLNSLDISSSTFLVAEADLYRGRYLVPAMRDDGVQAADAHRLRFVPAPQDVPEIVLDWDGERLSGSYRHIVRQARPLADAAALSGREASDDQAIVLPAEAMTLLLTTDGDGSELQAWIHVSSLRFDGDRLEAATGLVLLTMAPESRP